MSSPEPEPDPDLLSRLARAEANLAAANRTIAALRGVRPSAEECGQVYGVLRCGLPSGHYNYHRDAVRGPFGPWLAPPLAHEGGGDR